jgi:hypothetical protein
VTRCRTIEEVCEKSDAIIILAPSNPETHLGYAEKILPFGKPTYIDKTFAPTPKEAKAIFELGEKYGTPFFTTSALRYATELDDIKDPKFLNVWGGGGNFPEYSIHQIEMVIKLMNVGHKSVNVSKTEKGCVCDIVMEDGRKVQLNYAPDFPFAIENENGKVNIASSFFDFLIVDILKFFETGAVSFDKEQTLMAMDLREKIVEQL